MSGYPSSRSRTLRHSGSENACWPLYGKDSVTGEVPIQLDQRKSKLRLMSTPVEPPLTSLYGWRFLRDQKPRVCPLVASADCEYAFPSGFTSAKMNSSSRSKMAFTCAALKVLSPYLSGAPDA